MIIKFSELGRVFTNRRYVMSKALNQVFLNLREDLATFHGGTIYDYRIVAANKIGFVLIISKIPIEYTDKVISVVEKYGDILSDYGLIIDGILENPKEVTYDEF